MDYFFFKNNSKKTKKNFVTINLFRFLYNFELVHYQNSEVYIPQIQICKSTKSLEILEH